MAFSYLPQNDDELELKVGDIIEVVGEVRVPGGWVQGLSWTVRTHPWLVGFAVGDVRTQETRDIIQLSLPEEIPLERCASQPAEGRCGPFKSVVFFTAC